MMDEIDQLGVNAVRALSVDMIQKANSGHPGLPLGAAPMAYTLFTRHLRVNPAEPTWFNRDRFVLSAGHGSAMLYSLLHLSGFGLAMDDLKEFRQKGSRTPGHPEYGQVPGVDATTGPLGQGLGMAVGMAMAEAHLGATYNQGAQVVDHYTYALCGDGDLMEGVSHEAASLAGHLKLGKLIVLYDSNDVSLDGAADRALTDSAEQRFESYGWHYLKVTDGNDLNAIDAALTQAKTQTDAPTLIEVKTIIGYGAPKQGTNQVHGAPLGTEGVAATKTALHWTAPAFTVPDKVYQRFQQAVAKRGQQAQQAWHKQCDKLAQVAPALHEQLSGALQNQLPTNWALKLPTYQVGDTEASRATSHKVIQGLAAQNPNLWGGSADLASSNKTDITATGSFEADALDQRNICFGVREFAEGAAMNGIALHGGTHVFGGTFFVFSDYMRGALRLAALQKLPVTYVFTHDSIAVGEDGPTHEPVEQLMSLRAMPGITVLRPADANETVAAWKLAMTIRNRPTVLVLTRQNLAVLAGTAQADISRGGYVLSPQKGHQPEGILIATGSEVALAVAAQRQLAQQNHDVSVVSLPSFDLFDRQPRAYREQILPTNVRLRVSVEMGSTLGWGKYVGLDGVSVGINQFGASGAMDQLLEDYGFTSQHIVDQYLQMYVAQQQLNQEAI